MKILVYKASEVHLVADVEGPARRALSNHFAFTIPGARWTPAFKSGLWDGKKRLYDMRTGALYAGLLPRLEAWAEKHGHELTTIGFPDGPEPIDIAHVKRFIDGLGLPFPPRDYQLATFVAAIRHRRGAFLAATSSGKSLSIYLIARWLADEYGLKVLLVVPTIGLVKQMESDIASYGGTGYTTAIHGGRVKDAETPIVVSTWQSIHKLDPDWFSQFGVLIADECITGDSLINMANGLHKPIRDVREGDLITTLNETTHEWECQPVLRVHQNLSIDEELFEIETDTGNVLQVTGNHKVRLENGSWVRADELKIGDRLSTTEGVNLGGIDAQHTQAIV